MQSTGVHAVMVLLACQSWHDCRVGCASSISVAGMRLTWLSLCLQDWCCWHEDHFILVLDGLVWGEALSVLANCGRSAERSSCCMFCSRAHVLLTHLCELRHSMLACLVDLFSPTSDMADMEVVQTYLHAREVEGCWMSNCVVRLWRPWQPANSLLSLW